MQRDPYNSFVDMDLNGKNKVNVLDLLPKLF